ncbi:hypothetical protein, partial [Rhodococcus sp. HNM0563]|uniref:hypothetical protein n=1 Tax=Rhodococcus sp. HNM0563 TaxID=2716339 RepID=UPI00197D3753
MNAPQSNESKPTVPDSSLEAPGQAAPRRTTERGGGRAPRPARAPRAPRAERPARGRGRGVVLPQLLVSAVESCGDAVAV